MPSMPTRRTLVCLASAGFLTHLLSAQTIRVIPPQVMADQQAAITVTGLQPHQRVTLQADLTDGALQTWTSKADFIADDSGSVDTSKQPPEKGSSYDIVSAMGLVWSMKPTGRDVHSYQAPRNTEDIHFALMIEGHPAAEAQLQQTFLPTDRHEVKLTGSLHGILYLPTTPGPHPGVLVLGGSEGGLASQKAVWLVSHGYAALALAYFRYEGLPTELQNIPLEYFGQAIQWMQQRPEIDASRIAVIGTSRGGELALQLGAMYPAIRAVVAYVPANARIPSCCGSGSGLYAAWTWQGIALPYARPTSRSAIPNDLDSVIPVEHTHGPILLVSGQDDDIWPSEGMTSAITRRLQVAKFTHEVVRLNYAHAGHRAGMPFIVPTWSHDVHAPITDREESFGGTPEGNALSTLDATPKVLAFLTRSLATTSATQP